MQLRMATRYARRNGDDKALSFSVGARYVAFHMSDFYFIVSTGDLYFLNNNELYICYTDNSK